MEGALYIGPWQEYKLSQRVREQHQQLQQLQQQRWGDSGGQAPDGGQRDAQAFAAALHQTLASGLSAAEAARVHRYDVCTLHLLHTNESPAIAMMSETHFSPAPTGAFRSHNAP